MRVYVETVLHCPAEKIWDEVQRCSLLVEVARPLITLAAVETRHFPDRWVEGATIRCKSYMFGIIPLGTRIIFFERIDQATWEIQSRERDRLIHRWDHLVCVRQIADGQAHYSDEIIIEAGWLTLPVWLFAQCFYRHRQRRWQAVARRLMDGQLR